MRLHLDRLRPSTCVLHRPGYKCDGGPIFSAYNVGAWSAACAAQPPFTEGAFPRDHLRDIFSSWSSVPAWDATQRVMPAAAPVTLFVTRERSEHANLFHTMADWLNAFITYVHPGRAPRVSARAPARLTCVCASRGSRHTLVRLQVTYGRRCEWE
ncbi:hypothetical protein EON66_02965 [archaeon]|nr:MAG: hypothetical protein EON66_02965 [archaeon]